MRRALPTIVISAAGVTWLLHAQGVIDAEVASGGATTDTTSGASGAAAGPTTSGRASTSPTTSTTATTVRPGRTAPTAPTTPTTPPTTTAGDTGSTVTGPSVSTKFGPVQVAVVVSGGQVTDVKTLQSPTAERRSQQINNRALPVLRQEAVAAQSAEIDSVSGATITSDAYATSLQAALDAAGLR